MPYNLLLLPLLGGFLFFHITHFFRFAAQRLDGYRLLFQCAIAGIFLSIGARLLVLGIAVSPAGPAAEHYWDRFSPFPYSGTSAVSLLLGPLVALLVNVFVSREKAIDMEIRRHGNSLTKLLHRAQTGNFLVSITLDTRKWYVGWVAESTNLDPQEFYFRLLPFMSGYRDAEKLETHRTVFYQDVLNDQKLDPEQLFITVPLKDVKLANLFLPNVYNEYFVEETEESESEPQP